MLLTIIHKQAEYLLFAHMKCCTLYNLLPFCDQVSVHMYISSLHLTNLSKALIFIIYH